MSFKCEFKDASVLCITETWLDPLTPDTAVTAPGHTLFRADRCAVLSQKKKGGGVCFLVSQRWCNDAKLVSQSCSVELETLIVNCRFSSVVLVGVYIPPEVNAAKAINQLADQVLAVENTNPDSVVIVVGDFNHTCLSKALPRYKQHVDCPTHKDKTLDHCYTVYKRAYHASARAPLGKSDHNTVILIPAYRQKLKTVKPVKKTAKKWSPESTEALRGCFEYTDLSVFEHACTDLGEYTVTAYVSFCVESCIPTRTVCGYANDKPWFTKEVKNKLVAKDAAFRIGDDEEFRRAKYDARRAIARAKAKYKLEDQFASNNTHAVWQGLQTITQYKAKSATISSDPTLPDRLNELYARFDRQYSAAAEPLHLHPPSSLTPAPTAGLPPTGHTCLWSSAVASSSSPHPPSHRTGLWSSAVASSPHPHPATPTPTGPASGHQLSPPAPTPPPTGPAYDHELSPPAPPPIGPAYGHQLSLQAPTLPPTGPAPGHQLSPPAPTPTPPHPPPDRPLVIRYRLQPPPPPPHTPHRTGLWSSDIASSPHPHPPTPPTGPASGHQISPPAPTPTPHTPHRTGLWSSDIASSPHPHPPHPPPDRPLVIRYRLQPPPPPPHTPHRTGLWSSDIASSPHPHPPTPPTGPASGHQISPPAPTPTPPHRTGLWSSDIASSPHPHPPHPPPDRPLVIRYRLQHPQLDLLLLLVISRLLLISPPDHYPVFTCGLTRATGTAIRHTGEGGQKLFPEPEPQGSVRPWQRVPCHPEVVCRPAGSSVHCSVQQVAGAMPHPAMLQDLHHSAGSQEAQHSKPERLPTSRSDLRSHESVRAPGSRVIQISWHNHLLRPKMGREF